MKANFQDKSDGNTITFPDAKVGAMRRDAKQIDDEMVFDERDISILEYVRTHPSASVEGLVPEIEKTLQIPKATTKKRIRRLFGQHYLERVIRVVSLASLGYKLHYRIDLNIHPAILYKKRIKLGRRKWRLMKQEDLAEYILDELANEPRFKNQLICDDVTIFLGHRADMSLTVHAKSIEAIREFVINGLRPLPEVQNTHTAQQVWSALSEKSSWSHQI